MKEEKIGLNKKLERLNPKLHRELTRSELDKVSGGSNTVMVSATLSGDGKGDSDQSSDPPRH